ncbi:MAG: polysaccharide deacetylase family protein [Thermoanaerobacterales bacterium]|nr:polysaccharide deacetylase family protein [Thermoanaerobacterales bacterium]
MDREVSQLNLANIKDKKIACLTLDVECDFGDLLAEPKYEGIKYIPGLVEFFKTKDLPLTCFIQGSLMETHSEYIDKLAEINADCHLHSYSHPGPGKSDFEYEIKAGKVAYKEFFGCEPIGYRAPLGVISEEDLTLLAREGFKFDSSIFPSFRPGAFNNLNNQIEPYITKSGIVEIPFSVLSKWVRIPLSLSYIKLFGWPYRMAIKKCPLPHLIIFDFHLHDLFHLESLRYLTQQHFSPLYRYIYNKIYLNQKVDGLKLLEGFVDVLKESGYSFMKLSELYNLIVEDK